MWSPEVGEEEYQDENGEIRMKYFDTFQMKADSREKLMAKYNAIQDERKQFPDRYPTRLTLADGSLARARVSVKKSHVLYDGTEEQMINLAVRFFHEVEFTFTLCLEPEKIQAAFEELG